MENNKCKVTGVLSTEFKFDHEAYGERFFKGFISCKRKSGTEDIVPILVSEKLLGEYVNKRVCVSGSFRSHNFNDNYVRKLSLNLFVEHIEEITDEEEDANEMFADGYICKQPVYRRTPLGREIAEFIVAINRPSGKSDYIPCICWGRNAKFSTKLAVGDRISFSGRIQSREYMKKLGGNETEKRIAYEVSVSNMSRCE